jgi:septal ring factor EnvC (AmiA/AmiB activator)
MGMHLLKKQEVDVAKARDRQREVNEGAKLAKRVDRLRELVAIEDAALKKFRAETLKTIHDEIEKATADRNSLIGEVQRLKKERRELQKPLDEEWDKVRELEKALTTRQKTLENKEVELDELHKKAREIKKLADGALKRVASAERRAHELHAEAEQDRKQAKKERATAATVVAEANLLKKNVGKEVIERRREVAIGEKNLALRNEYLDNRERELERGWAALKDRQEMFERTINRKK